MRLTESDRSEFFSSESTHTDVLVVGGGPVGLAAGIEFSRRGLSVIVVERHPSTSIFPKARLITTRTMELCREWGIHDEVESTGIPREQSLALGIGSSLTSDDFRREVARIDEDAPQSPTYSYICAQDLFEQILLRRARAANEVEVRFETAMTTFTDYGDQVAVTVESPQGTSELRARYLVAADGHVSGVRRALDISTEGPPPLGQMLAVLFDADLGSMLDHRRGALYFLHGEIYCAVEAVDNERRWTLQLAYEPENGESPDDFTDERCVELVRAAAGAPDLEVSVIRVMPWIQQAFVAERFRSGNVFLAGDAAHVATPQGGFGMNLGIQDVHNLAWKIGAVVDGSGGIELLDTYESERKPIAEWTVKESLVNAAITVDMMEGRLTVQEAGDLQAKRRRSEGLVLGFCYESAAVLTDGTAAPLQKDPYTNYVASGRPGHLLPHLRIRHDGAELSIKDVIAQNFTLLTAVGSGWLDAVRELSELVRAQVEVVEIDLSASALLDDADEPWYTVLGVGESGAMLVRPDGQVAWRSARPVAGALLEVAVNRVLGISRSADDNVAVGR